MSKVYSTSEVAKLIGIHPNTVRLYEELNLISKPERKSNGYRVFTQQHIEQFRVARLAFEVEVLQSGLRKQAVTIIKTSAENNFSEAIKLTQDYLEQVRGEKQNAEEAISLVEEIISGTSQDLENLQLTRQEAADLLHITIDTLRNWELNGLLSVKRKLNGYRVYTETDIKRLKIIRSLRCANYSLASILRMLQALSDNPKADIRTVIDTPKADDDIFTACDSLLSSLNHAEHNFHTIYQHLIEMEKTYFL